MQIAQIAQIAPERTLLRRILDHDADYWSAVSVIASRPGYILFHNAELAPRIDPNHAGAFRAPAGTATAIVAEIVAFYRSLGVTAAAFLDACTSPVDLRECLLAAGFVAWDGALSDLMLFVGPDSAPVSDAAVEVVQSHAQRLEWAAIVEEQALADAQAVAVLERRYLREIGDPRVIAYLVRAAGQAASRCILFSAGGLGRVEAVRTRAAYRGRGLASAAIRRAVMDSIGLGNEFTYIYAEPGAGPQRIYHRLGFRTICERATEGYILPGHAGQG